MTDPWSYQADMDESRMRMAALSVQWFAGAESTTIEAGNVVRVRVESPWWAAATLGIWRKRKQSKVEKRCRETVPKMVGWCPQIEVTHGNDR